MADWPRCTACRDECDDPLDRRHHAQPTACNRCGPGYRLFDGGGPGPVGVRAIARAADMLNEGMILAVKGVGGNHLTCSARDVAAVRRLRERKFRKENPFALMARDLDTAGAIARLGELHCSLLLDTARPIVLAPSRVTFPGIAEDTDELGVMLPYTPLHELLFHFGAPNPLVMTSANRSSEPIAYLDDDAMQRLGGLADGFLNGERPVARRVEDSVIAVRDGQSTMIRRSRGFAPAAVARLHCDHPILAVGADLKNSLTLVVSGEAICGQYVGDLGDLDTDRAFEQTVRDLLAMYEIDRRDLLVVHDAHPEYVSTRFAVQLDCHRRVAVQHHRAHLASVMAERGELDRPVVGIALDGTGYGDDASIWGFEVFTGSVVDGFRRVAHMRSAKLPGGDAAARHSVQAAAGFLADLDVPDLREPPFNFPERFFRAQMLVAKSVRCFTTTSAGRLFETVAALCGFTREITFEGQAAVWLEHQARDVRPAPAYPFPALDYRPLLASVIADRHAGRDVGEISYAFHAAVARELARTAAGIARSLSIRHVALSGGVFQNRLLRSLLNDQEDGGRSLTLLFNQSVPPNDSGISLGQAALASVTTP
jgi:hydrogenase maturation protein HypF